MAQYVSLEEAAQRLGVSTADFKRRLKTEWTQLVPMRDGPTLRFRVNQIDDLARQLGASSDPSLPLANLDADAPPPGSDDFKVPGSGKGKKAPVEQPLVFDAGEDDIFSLTDDVPPLKAPPGTDSDARIEGPKSRKPDRDDALIIPTEEISLDLSGPGSAVIKGGSSAKLSAPKSSAKLSPPDSGKKITSDSGRNLGNSPLGDSSEFELSLDADSDDFELQLTTDSSDEVDLGSSPVDEGGRSGKSGVNLRNPGDSGVSLEKGGSGRNLGKKSGDSSSKSLSAKKGGSGVNLGGKKTADSGRNLGGKKSDSGRNLAPPADDNDSDVDFELSLEEEPPSGGQSGARLGGPRSSSKIPITSDSDSEFELTLDSSDASLEAAALAEDDVNASKGDIFETDFEIPPMSDESGSEAVALDSDTDLEDSSELEVALAGDDIAAEDESASQVVVLEDEEDPDAAPAPKARKKKPAFADEDEEEDGIGSALAGVKGRRHDEDEDEDDAEAVRGGVMPPAPWGPLPALILAPAFVLVIIGGLMGYELLHTMMGYQQVRKPAAPLVRAAAKAFDMELKDQ